MVYGSSVDLVLREKTDGDGLAGHESARLRGRRSGEAFFFALYHQRISSGVTPRHFSFWIPYRSLGEQWASAETADDYANGAAFIVEQSREDGEGQELEERMMRQQ